jgi:hypothetical protein
MKPWKFGDKNPLSLQVDFDRPNIFHPEDFDKETAPATRDEKAAQQRMRPSTSFLKDATKRFAKNPRSHDFRHHHFPLGLGHYHHSFRLPLSI